MYTIFFKTLSVAAHADILMDAEITPAVAAHADILMDGEITPVHPFISDTEEKEVQVK